MQKNIKRVISMYFMICACLFFSACGTVNEEQTVEESETDNNAESIIAPSKEEVIAMRAVVLEGMSEEEIERLTENIKVANSAMESAYLNDNIFDKLSDKLSDSDSPLEFYEREYEPGMEYNRFDAANFIELIEDMQSSVQNEKLSADLQQLIDLAYMASVTHEMEYANQIYKNTLNL